MLKLPSNKNSNLVQFEFWNGNSWITTGFDHKEDLIFCKERLNSEKQDLIKFIQLWPKDNGKEEEEKVEKVIKTDLHKSQPEPSVVGKLSTKDQDQNIKSSIIQLSIKLIQKEIINNPFEICQKTTKFRGGFLAANIPGENRNEQLDYMAAVLQISSTNSLISPIFHQSNSWIIAYFPSQEKLNKCINKVKSQNTHEINIIALSNNNSKGQKNKGKVIYKEETPIKFYDLTKSYRIMDIPGDFSNDRIKGALKPFGKVIEFE